MKINKHFQALLFGCYSIVLSGCADVTTKAIGNDEKECSIWNSEACGIRHYGYKVPFILLTQRTDGGVDSSLIYLPDTTNIYSTRPYAFISDNNTRLNFSKGVLEYSKSVIDETKLPTVTMQIVAALAENAAKAFMAFSTEIPPSVPPDIHLAAPALFRIFVKGNELVARGKYNGNDIIVNLTTATVTPTQQNQPAGGK